MANSTTVYADMVVESDTEEGAEALIKLLEKAGSFDYPTEIVDDQVIDDTGATHRLHLIAVGHNSYSGNIRDMFSDIYDAYGNDKKTNELLDIIKTHELLDIIKTHAYSIETSWKEYDAGLLTVGRGTCRHTKNAGDPYESLYSCERHDEYAPMSLESLDEFGFDASEWVDASEAGIDGLFELFSDNEKVEQLSKFSSKQVAEAAKENNISFMYQASYFDDWPQTMEYIVDDLLKALEK